MTIRRQDRGIEGWVEEVSVAGAPIGEGTRRVPKSYAYPKGAHPEVFHNDFQRKRTRAVDPVEHDVLADLVIDGA